MRIKRVLVIAVIHFIAFQVTFLSAFGDGRDQGAATTILSQVLGVIVAVLWLPLRLLGPFVASGSFLIDMALLAVNSLIWGVVLDRLMSIWRRTN